MPTGDPRALINKKVGIRPTIRPMRHSRFRATQYLGKGIGRIVAGVRSQYRHSLVLFSTKSDQCYAPKCTTVKFKMADVDQPRENEILGIRY